MGNKRRRNSSSSSESSASSDEDDRIQSKSRPADSTSSSSEDDDEDWNERSTASKKKAPAKSRAAAKPQRKIAKQAVKESDNESEPDEREEGEVEDDDDEFNDGYDENLMGDEEDKKRLLQMTEKEREQELFNRSEKREVLKTRFEIEKKLRLQKKKEQNKSISFSDAQLRSTDRRKALENNRKQKDGLKQLKGTFCCFGNWVCSLSLNLWILIELFSLSDHKQNDRSNQTRATRKAQTKGQTACIRRVLVIGRR